MVRSEPFAKREGDAVSNLRKLAHLEEQLGERAFDALISSGNTACVRAFARLLSSTDPHAARAIRDRMTMKVVPTRMTVGDRTYEILSPLSGTDLLLNFWNPVVEGERFLERSRAMGAALGEDEAQYLLDKQGEIPVGLQGMIILFPSWTYRCVGSMKVGCIFDVQGQWRGGGQWLTRGRDLSHLVLRRIAS